jgi:hypothetical protein
MFEISVLRWRHHIAAYFEPAITQKRVRPAAASQSTQVPLYHRWARRMSSSCVMKHENFFRYSGGRWLWNEEKQLQDRYKRFNVTELQNIAAQRVGAQACASMVKLAEGGFNKVFRLVMDNGTVVIARIPNPNAGPAFKTTASEVATMDFVRQSASLSEV